MQIQKLIPEAEEREILYVLLSVIALLVSFFEKSNYPIDTAWLAVVLCGFPILKESSIEFFTKYDIKADVLVSLALIASVWIGEIFAAGEIAVIMTIGSMLEEKTVSKAREGIKKLVEMTPQTARLVRNGKEEIIPADDARVGDILRVLAGETIPVDGDIVSGQTSIDQSVMTGESLPVDKGIGDHVFSGTVNQFGTFEMHATEVGEKSSLQRMIRLVESTDAGKAKIVKLADRWATWIVIAALVSAAGTWIITDDIIRAVTILVVFCPCGLVLATPTAIVAGIGNATKYGILVREGDALERLAGVHRVVFDKTGTLTCGEPAVVAVESFDQEISTDDLLSITASAELRSGHPIGKAVLRYFNSSGNKTLQEPSDFEMVSGSGISSVVNNRIVLAGNEKLLQSRTIIIPSEMKKSIDSHKNKGYTLICVAIDNCAVGLIALSDYLREDSCMSIKKIHGMGLASSLFTGDNPQAANHIAGIIGINDVRAQCLPEDKMMLICKYQEKGEHVCMLGDGVNDAPALKVANVGIAMGSVGSDIAIEAADIALVEDDIKHIPHLLGLSHKTMKTIRQNLTFSMGLNFVAIALAMTGMLNPVAGALVHNAGSVLVIINSSLLLNWKLPPVE